MTECKLYESPLIRQVTGETIRPGGFTLTERAVDACGFGPGAEILDIGCGSGATVEFLRQKFLLNAVGVDPSPVQLQLGKQRNPQLPIIQGCGENLPFGQAVMDGVLAECSMSLMSDLAKAIAEVNRVLKQDGRLVINDVYARNPMGVAPLREMGIATCLRGALLKEELENVLLRQGFKVVLWEDHSQLFKQLAGQMIFTYGSMNSFWLKSSACSIDPDATQRVLREAKIGYFQLIAQKIFDAVG